MTRLLAVVATRTTVLLPIAVLLALLAAGLTVLGGRPVQPAARTVVSVTATAALGAVTPASTVPGGLTPAPSAGEPTVTATAPPQPTVTPNPADWRGQALTEAIIRERATTTAPPAGLLLAGEAASIDEVVVGEEVEPGNRTWYRVHAGAMSGYVYGSLFQPGPRPAGR